MTIYFYSGHIPVRNGHPVLHGNKKEFCGLWNDVADNHPVDVMDKIILQKKEELGVQEIVLTAFNTVPAPA